MLPILAGDGVLIFGRASNALPFFSGCDAGYSMVQTNDGSEAG